MIYTREMHDQSHNPVMERWLDLCVRGWYDDLVSVEPLTERVVLVARAHRYADSGHPRSACPAPPLAQLESMERCVYVRTLSVPEPFPDYLVPAPDPMPPGTVADVAAPVLPPEGTGR